MIQLLAEERLTLRLAAIRPLAEAMETLRQVTAQRQAEVVATLRLVAIRPLLEVNVTLLHVTNQ